MAALWRRVGSRENERERERERDGGPRRGEGCGHCGGDERSVFCGAGARDSCCFVLGLHVTWGLGRYGKSKGLPLTIIELPP
jgi:hypothetical protein